MLAFDVPGETLKQLRDEGDFISKARFVGPLMDDAKGSLRWGDWDALREAVRRRNAVAHDGALHPRSQCWADIDSVETQLNAWGVLV
jgi:hypothetical protein